MRQVVHPGPVAADRLDLCRVVGRPVDLTLRAGIPLEDAVGQAMTAAGYGSGYLEMCDASVRALSYVIPDHAPDAGHVAWYSPVRTFPGPGRIDRMAMIVGQHAGRSFLHGHGRWTPRGGRTALGHILAPDTVLAEAARVSGIGVSGGGFRRRHDPETAFDLFQTNGAGDPKGDHALLRIRPNEDLGTALHAACDRLGWTVARAFGLGSLNCAAFDDGRHLNSLPTEFYILDAPLGTGTPPEIDIVGIDGDTLLQGRLSPGCNPVLVTAEIVLRRLAG